MTSESKDKRPHVVHNSANNEWYTPPYIIEAARASMGSIDTDPATSLKANEVIQADLIYSLELGSCGLENKWLGNVWLNPPYARGLVKRFIDQAIRQHQLGNAKQLCVLTNNATETKWFQKILAYSDAVCFFKQRLRFILPCGNLKGSPLQGQVLFYIGENKERFSENFSQYGLVL